MGRWFSLLLVVAGIFLTPAPALAECKMGTFGALPVTMLNRRPIVTVQINGRDARFILDSGASFSTISEATAKQYGLRVTDLPNATLKGIGGSASLGTTTVSKLGIAGTTVSDVTFHVGGSDTGFAGLLGQNFLGIEDVEYDLPHGMVRFVKGTGCKDISMAYWAGSKPTALMQIEPREGRPHTIGTVKINGVKIRALIDSGASGGSIMSLAAAKRIGVTPDSPGVKPSGFALGLGQDRIRVWEAAFDAIDMGGETINKPKIKIMDQTLDAADMLIGIDFFLTHRILVDNENRRMFFTYEGGPLFGLNPKGAFDSSTGEALDLTDKAGDPTDAAGYSRRGALLATGQKFNEAIADFDKAVAMDPGNAHYLFQRANARLSNRQTALAMADLDKAIELAPGDTDARLQRAQIRSGRDPAGALADLQAADKALAPSSDARLRLAQAYENVGADESALTNYDQWLKSHPEDHDKALALDRRCLTRAALNRDLDKALDDCNSALRMRPGEPGILSNRALVLFKRGEFDKALADYDIVVKAQPRNGLALYARSLIERRTGKIAQADTDRAAALAINPQVATRAKRYRLEE